MLWEIFFFFFSNCARVVWCQINLLFETKLKEVDANSRLREFGLEKLSLSFVAASLPSTLG